MDNSKIKKSNNLKKVFTIIIFCLGIFLLVLGLFYPIIMNDKNNKNSGNVKNEKVEEKIVECNLSINENDGSIVKFINKLNFSNKKLKKYSKTYSIVAPIDNNISLTKVNDLVAIYKKYDTTGINGYSITVNEIDNGMKLITDVDLEKVDKGALEKKFMIDALTTIDYEKNALENEVIDGLRGSGYTCKEI